MENNPLYFTKLERIGMLVFAVLLVVILWLPNGWGDRSEATPTDFSELQAQLQTWSTSGAKSVAREQDEPAAPTKMAAAPFEPNTATREQLTAAGLKAATIRSWLSYTRKGGQFNDWAAIEKFRALSDADKKRLRPLLQFPVRTSTSSSAPIATDISAEATLPTHAFDPHAVTATELQSWGLSEKVARNWVKFTGAGARFRQAQDIEKIYGITPEDVQRLLPYIEIPVIAETSTFTTNTSKPPRPTFTGQIDINQASAEEWQQLKGIGPGYSRRITNFREKLGGFHSIDQIAQTYGLPDSVFQAIRPQLTASPIKNQLKINQMNVDELAAHPYIRYPQARIIVKYREEHGSFADFSALTKIYGLQDEFREKIKPYLSFE